MLRLAHHTSLLTTCAEELFTSTWDHRLVLNCSTPRESHRLTLHNQRWDHLDLWLPEAGTLIKTSIQVSQCNKHLLKESVTAQLWRSLSITSSFQLNKNICRCNKHSSAPRAAAKHVDFHFVATVAQCTTSITGCGLWDSEIFLDPLLNFLHF